MRESRRQKGQIDVTIITRCTHHASREGVFIWHLLLVSALAGLGSDLREFTLVAATEAVFALQWAGRDVVSRRYQLEGREGDSNSRKRENNRNEAAAQALKSNAIADQWKERTDRQCNLS
jgi:hypothetical protein